MLLRLEKQSAYNKLLFFFFCLFVFLIPFEHILELWYGIETKLKPYRVAGILLVIFGFFYNIPKKRFIPYSPDMVMLFLIAFGNIYTIYLWAFTGNVVISQFANDSFQIVFLLLIYLSVKKINLSWGQIHTILNIYTLAMVLNALAIIIDYYFLETLARTRGFADNSNTAAFSIGIAIFYLQYRLMVIRWRVLSIKFWVILLLLLYFLGALFATGSRGGLAITIIGFVSLFFVFSSNKFKLKVLGFSLIGFLVIFGFSFRSLENNFLAEKISNNAAFNRLGDSKTDIRFQLWEAGILSVLDKKFMGLGIAQFRGNRANFVKYMTPVDRNLPFHVKGLGIHNLYLETLVDYGIIPFFSLFYFFWLVLKTRIRGIKQNKNRPFQAFLMTIFISVLLSSIFGKGLLSAIFWFSIFLTTLVHLKTQDPLEKEKLAKAVA